MRLRLAQAGDDRAAELLAAIGEDAAAAGVAVVEDGIGAAADAPSQRRPDDVVVFVASPETSIGLPEGRDRVRSVALCMEFPGSDAFDVATAAAASAGAVLTLSRAGAIEQRRRGLRARHLRLGLSRRWRLPSPKAPSERARDVLFIGAHSPRRERMIACNAAHLARMRAGIWLGSPWPGSPGPPSGRQRRELLAESSMVLDFHPRARPNRLDRMLALEALGAGALPVFEHSIELEELEAGVHLALADGAQLGLVAGCLAEEAPLLDRMACEARAYAEAALSPRPAIDLLATVADDVARRASRAERWRIRLRPGHGHGEESEPARDAPMRPDVRSADGGRLRLAATTLRKRSVLTAIERRGAARAATLARHGLGNELSCVYESSAWQGPARRVAVCVPVHDDGDLAVEALESAVASAGVEIELLVADDASGDGSLHAVRRWLRRHEHVPARLFASGVNRGVGAVRNDMMAAASAPLAFMLDADNLLFPDGLGRLVEALEGEPGAAFAYGVLERTEGGRSVGLIGIGPWEPERLRDGNYIDAMALLRRDWILGIGGFATDRRLYGWEDFDLWCRVAEEGGDAVFVPELIGRYRSRGGSMLSVAEIDSKDAVALLHERSPRLRPSIPARA